MFCFDSYGASFDVEYVRQKANPSETVVSGVVLGGRAYHHHQTDTFGYKERVYFGAGVLTGQDAFDDVKVNYNQFEGEILGSYCFLCDHFQWTPFVGAGYRRHYFKREFPFKMHQETNTFYVPVGVFGDYFVSECFHVGGEVKVDLLAYGYWKFAHPLFPQKGYHLMWRPSFEVDFWVNYHVSYWTFFVTPSYQYIPLDYPGEISFSPESKHLSFFGVRIGAAFNY